VSSRQRTEIDREFYQAVTAYVKGDYADARGLLTDILRVDPADKDALSLRRRVLAAQKISAP
jgi:cytochrome c-type biogenesis protein CcmH/NrfG